MKFVGRRIAAAFSRHTADQKAARYFRRAARRHLSRISGARKSVVATAAAAPCSRCNISFVPFTGTQFGLVLRPAQCKFVKDRGGVIRQAINFEKPGAARRAQMLCGNFFAISLQSSLSLARAGQRGVAGVAAGCWVVGGATAGAAACRAAQ